MSEAWLENRLGHGEFVYRFGRAEESPLHSVWIFEFYGTHWAAGYTSPMEGQPNITFDPTGAFPRPSGSVGARESTWASCDFCATSTRLDREADLCAEACQHVDQRVRAEQVDAPSEEVADARLRHPKDFGRLSLL